MQLSWPITEEEILFFVQSLLIWLVAGYVAIDTTADPSGKKTGSDKLILGLFGWGEALVAILAAFVSLALAGREYDHTFKFALLVGFLVILGPILRRLFESKQSLRDFSAELEVSYLFLCIGLIGTKVGQWSLTIASPALNLPFGNQSIIVGALVCCTAVLACRPGTYFVRGLLRKVSDTTHPSGSDSLLVPQKEIARGRFIGNLERIVIVYACVAEGYEVIGFLVAAKGLIRSRKFIDNDQDDFVEYFIIGNLSSILYAIALAEIFRLAVRLCTN